MSNCILDIRWWRQPIFCKPYCIHMLWLVMGNKSFKGIPVSDLSHLPPKDYAQKLSFNKWACRFNFGFSCVIITFSKKRYNLQAGVNFLTNMCTIISEHVKIHYKLNLENWKDERGRVSNEITYKERFHKVGFNTHINPLSINLTLNVCQSVIHSTWCVPPWILEIKCQLSSN